MKPNPSKARVHNYSKILPKEGQGREKSSYANFSGFGLGFLNLNKAVT